MQSMRAAYDKGQRPENARISFVDVHEHRAQYDNPETDTLPKLLKHLVAEIDAGPAPALWVSRIGGNEHNMLSLLEHDRPIDFILPGHEHLGLQDGAEIVTCAYIREVVSTRLERNLKYLPEILEFCPVPLIQVQAPPPIGDTDHILNNLGAFGKNLTGTPRIAANAFRWKVWRLQSQLTEEFCRGLEVPFLENPDPVFSDGGFLRDDLLGRDPTHGNRKYGQIMNDLIVQIARGEAEVPA
ncbi:hypothetical protein [Marimonas arenosa]|uniref:Uncharacterized protein n=1 Tax=Marimonas arenosa TaxID=1795305 RepID=A0AAE3WDM8_9RHOB|nr:hypothetical protein [Marimonas arenosa]MDQ2089792.1 hypothetical protein [Marimonas arenosa]